MTQKTTQLGIAANTLTVAITTYNRKDELGECLEKVLAQDYPCEILVIDDASSDGTAEFVRSAYPRIRVERSEENLGLIGQRTRSAHLASGDIIMWIDDDILIDAPGTLKQLVAAFDRSEIAAVTVPSIDILRDPNRIHQQPPNSQELFITAVYRGGAVAFRRAIFNSLGGYDALLYRQGEEMDLALRVYDAGYVIAMADLPPLLHLESPNRVRRQVFYFHARNGMLFCWWRVPWRSLPLYLVVRSFHLLKRGRQLGFFSTGLWGLLSGTLMGLNTLHRRKAAAPSVFKRFEELRRMGPIPFSPKY